MVLDYAYSIKQVRHQKRISLQQFFIIQRPKLQFQDQNKFAILQNQLINMQPSDLKLLGIGILSLGAIGYYIKKCTRQQNESKEKVKEFLKCYIQSLDTRGKTLREVMTVRNKQTNKKQALSQKRICFVNVQPKYNDSTFSLYERERSVFQKDAKYPNSDLLEHQMGGDFTFNSNGNKITCQLNDFKLSGALLYEKQTKKVQIFKGMNKLQPLVMTVLTVLNPQIPVSIYGKLFYDDGKLDWTVEPEFISTGLALKNTVESFYFDKIIVDSFMKFALYVSAIVVGYFTVAKPLHRYFSRKKQDPRIIEIANEVEFFKNKDYITVNEKNLLNCQVCLLRNVEMVYECGHLVVCSQCHADNLEKKCPLCKKESKRFMKIFMA